MASASGGAPACSARSSTIATSRGRISFRRFFEGLREADRPTVAFESPFRVRRALAALAETLPDRPVALARELTKVHEEVLRGTAAEVLAALGEPVRGEITLVISHEPH